MNQKDIEKILATAEQLVALKQRREELERARQDIDRQIEEVAGQIVPFSSTSNSAKVESPETEDRDEAGRGELSPPKDYLEKETELENLVASKIDPKTFQGRLVLFLVKSVKSGKEFDTDSIAEALQEDRRRTLYSLQTLRNRTPWITKPRRGFWGVDLEALRKDMT